MKASGILTTALLCWTLAGCAAIQTNDAENAMESNAKPKTAVQQHNGLLTVQSDYPAAETLQRIQAAITAKGLKVFTVLNHQEAARQAQLDMPLASVVVFGNPRLGTAMMVQSPTLAIDLPSKALVWDDGKGQVFVTLNTAEYLGQRHAMPAEHVQALQGLEKLVLAAVKKAP